MKPGKRNDKSVSGHIMSSTANEISRNNSEAQSSNAIPGMRTQANQQPGGSSGSSLIDTASAISRGMLRKARIIFAKLNDKNLNRVQRKSFEWSARILAQSSAAKSIASNKQRYAEKDHIPGASVPKRARYPDSTQIVWSDVLSLRDRFIAENSCSASTHQPLRETTQHTLCGCNGRHVFPIAVDETESCGNLPKDVWSDVLGSIKHSISTSPSDDIADLPDDEMHAVPQNISEEVNKLQRPQNTTQGAADKRFRRGKGILKLVVAERQPCGNMPRSMWPEVLARANLLFPDILAENPGSMPVMRELGWYESRFKSLLFPDQRSVDMFELALAKVGEVWPGTKVTIVDVDQIQSMPRAHIKLPAMISDPNIIMQLIHTSNPHINTTDWNVLKIGAVRYGFRMVLLLITEESVRQAGGQNAEIMFGFSRLKMYILHASQRQPSKRREAAETNTGGPDELQPEEYSYPVQNAAMEDDLPISVSSEDSENEDDDQRVTNGTSIA